MSQIRRTSTSLRQSASGSGWRPDSPRGVRHGLEARLPATPASARLARNFARELMRDWGLAALTDDVLLVTSELAANAIAAAEKIRAAAITVRLARTPDGVVVALADPASAGHLPALLPAHAAGPVLTMDPADQAGQISESGRGLMLTAAIAHRVGWYQAGNWTVVWAEINAPDAAAC
jgi:anti-sigma regulatory factor (Ser/Thr protein kinase)